VAEGERWDAIVVGGGPGGSTAAWRLARGGARVLVLDAARFPRVKLCAGWVTPAVWRTLEVDPAAYPHTIQPFSRATIELEGEVHETAWPTTASYGIVRKEFDDFLLRRAASAGAQVRDGMRVQAIERLGEGFAVSAGGERFVAPIVIGAGGHHCPVARALGDVSEEETVVVARESETRLGAALLGELTERSGTPELFAEPDFRGYGWYFTKGDFLNVGVGCVGGGANLQRRCEAMVQRLRDDGRLPENVEIEPFKGHAYALRLRAPRRIAGERFVLVGDAAGLARGVSGEGIGPAVESGALAADLALRARDGSRFEDAVARPYAQAIEARFGSGREGIVGRLLDLVPHGWIEAAARLVCRTPYLRRRFVFEGAFGMN